MIARVLAVALASTLAGCAQNAIFELTLELPASTASVGSVPVRSVAVLFDSNTSAFESSWDGFPSHRVTLEGTPIVLPLSVVASSAPQIEDPLSARIQYCEDVGGCDGVDPLSEVQLTFDRAFYLGEFTRYRLDATIPPDGIDGPTTIDACDVAGCRDGNAGTWCEGGVHLCEQP